MTRLVPSPERTMPTNGERNKVGPLSTGTESEDQSDSGKEDLSVPFGRSTRYALNNGFTSVDRGAPWKSTQTADADTSAADQATHNGFDALSNEMRQAWSVKQLGTWAHIDKTARNPQKGSKVRSSPERRPLASLLACVFFT